MPNDLSAMVAAISSRQDFVAFLDALRADLDESPQHWENITLDRFLEAWSAWITDGDGFSIWHGETPTDDLTWRKLGDSLLGAKVYE